MPGFGGGGAGDRCRDAGFASGSFGGFLADFSPGSRLVRDERYGTREAIELLRWALAFSPGFSPGFSPDSRRVPAAAEPAVSRAAGPRAQVVRVGATRLQKAVRAVRLACLVMVRAGATRLPARSGESAAREIRREIRRKIRRHDHGNKAVRAAPDVPVIQTDCKLSARALTAAAPDAPRRPRRRAADACVAIGAAHPHNGVCLQAPRTRVSPVRRHPHNGVATEATPLFVATEAE